MCFYGLMNKLVATQLLKDDSLKANRSKPVSAFWVLWTPCYIYWVRHVLTLALLFNYLEKSWMGTRLLEFGGIRLVINQSVVPVDLESSPEDRSCLYAVCTLWLISLFLDNQKSWENSEQHWTSISFSERKNQPDSYFGYGDTKITRRCIYAV